METAYQRVEKRMRILLRAQDGLEGAAVRSQRAEEVFLLAKQKTEKKQEEYDEAVAKLEEAKKKLEEAFLATMEGSGRGKGKGQGQRKTGQGQMQPGQGHMRLRGQGQRGKRQHRQGTFCFIFVIEKVSVGLYLPEA